MIRKRGKSYEVRVYSPVEKKMVSVGSRPTQKEARALAREREEDFAQHGAGPRTLVRTFVARWLIDRTAPGARNQWRETTLRHNTERIKPFLADFGDVELGALTKDLTTPWVLAHPGNLGATRACLGYAVQLGLLRDNPFAKLGVAETAKRKLKPDWLSLEQVNELAAAAATMRGEYGQHFAACILFAAYTCIRPAEMFALDPSDVDIDALEVHVRRQHYRDRTFGDTKNGEARTIVLPPPAADVLRAMPHYGESLFHTVRGLRFTTGSHRPYWVEVTCAVGRPGMDFYELRHFGATQLLERGLADWEVAVQMGHTDGGELVRTTYGHPSEQLARDRIKQSWAQERPGATKLRSIA